MSNGVTRLESELIHVEKAVDRMHDDVATRLGRLTDAIERFGEVASDAIFKASDQRAQASATLSRFREESKDAHDCVVQGLEHLDRELREARSELASRLSGVTEAISHFNQLTQVQLAAANTQLLQGNSHLGSLRSENAAGFNSVTQGIERVDDDLRRAMAGVVQMEVIRLVAESRAPLARLEAFGEEIQQRFAKAVEGVCAVRGQYDGLLAQVHEEYERKLRQIGEHIYRMYDDEFRAYAETPLALPPAAPVALPLEADRAQIEARTRTLEAAAERLRSDVLEPLRQALRNFERALADELACELPAGEADLALPVGFVIVDDGRRGVEFIVDARATNGPSGPRLACSADGTELVAQLARQQARVLTDWRGRALSLDERAAVKHHLRDFAARGLLDAALLPGYDGLLDEGALEVPQGEATRGDEFFEDLAG